MLSEKPAASSLVSGLLVRQVQPWRLLRMLKKQQEGRLSGGFRVARAARSSCWDFFSLSWAGSSGIWAQQGGWGVQSKHDGYMLECHPSDKTCASNTICFK